MRDGEVKAYNYLSGLISDGLTIDVLNMSYGSAYWFADPEETGVLDGSEYECEVELSDLLAKLLKQGVIPVAAKPLTG